MPSDVSYNQMTGLHQTKPLHWHRQVCRQQTNDRDICLLCFGFTGQHSKKHSGFGRLGKGGAEQVSCLGWKYIKPTRPGKEHPALSAGSRWTRARLNLAMCQGFLIMPGHRQHCWLQQPAQTSCARHETGDKWQSEPGYKKSGGYLHGRKAAKNQQTNQPPFQPNWCCLATKATKQKGWGCRTQRNKTGRVRLHLCKKRTQHNKTARVRLYLCKKRTQLMRKTISIHC